MTNDDNKPKVPAGFFRRASDAGERSAQRDDERTEDSPRSSDRDNDRPRRQGDRESRPRSSEGRSFRDRDERPGRRGDSRPPFKGKAKEQEEKLPENILFGIHPVREAIEAGTAIEKIYFRRAGGELSTADRGQVSALVELREQARQADIHIQEVPTEKLDRLSRRGNHQGVVAVTAAIEYKELNELVEELSAAIEAGGTPLVMILDSVTDVRNFGAIARSAECAGAAALVIPAKNSAPVNAEAIKSSAGALTLIPVCRAGSLKGAINLLKSIGIRCVAATEKSEKLIYEADMTGPTAIVMGSEDKGISRDLLSLCDDHAGIPLFGRIESLNVSAAAAVALFEARRQRFEKE